MSHPAPDSVPPELPAGDSTGSEKVQSDRELLRQAREEGRLLGAYIKLSGPGWLQSAITLGGGSLAGALFLGVMGGYSMLWLQLFAIICGVIMLSAISYVTLSTGRRPFEAINREINPVLGWGWLLATCLANIIFCMPQFSLCYDALDANIFSAMTDGGLGDGTGTKVMWTGLLFAAAFAIVLMNVKPGRAAKFFDLFLKALIGMVVICFFGVAIMLLVNGQVDLGGLFTGFIPDISQLWRPAGELRELVATLPTDEQDYWTSQIMPKQRSVMIATAATAVGINMTFLLPYSMLARGWDRPFRGLARFDLSTGMAIPYVLVTTCVVLASTTAFHAQIDDEMRSTDVAVMKTSPLFDGVKDELIKRIDNQLGAEAAGTTDEATKLQMAAALPEAEKQIAVSLVKRGSSVLAETLRPLLGESMSKIVFGLGVFGMGFSTIIILMLINGYAFREMFNQPDGAAPFIAGVLVAGLAGAMWWYFWQKGSDSRFWLAIFASTFASMLLPIAYITFFLMMNSRGIMGNQKPKGASMAIWNVLMAIACFGALANAATAIYQKITGNNQVESITVVILVVGFAILAAAGFTLVNPDRETIVPADE